MYQSLVRAFNLYIPAIILTVAGMVTIYSIQPNLATTQLVYFFAGLMVSLFINRLRFDQAWLPPFFWLALTTLVLIITNVNGALIRGSTRWLSIFGQQIQTSEFAKIGLILFSSSWFATKSTFSYRHYLGFILAMAIPTYLIYRQPDLGTALMIVAIGFISIIITGLSFKHLSFIIGLFILAIPLTYNQLQPYQRQRIDSFLNPEHDPSGAGYNAVQATIAAGSGQLIGRGLGQGTQSHLRFLPERHTDFIFASFVEELGFIGGMVIIIIYLWLCLSLISIAKHTDSTAHSIICLISAGLIFTQAFVNLGMNMGIMPITGVTLPFMSYGGSSLVSMYILLGICVGSPTFKSSSRVFHIR